METFSLFLVFLGLYYALYRRENKYTKREGLRRIPEASGWIPILGHFLQIGFRGEEFFEDCCKKYGKVFTIRMRRKKVAVIGHRDLVPSFCRADESTLSFYR